MHQKKQTKSAQMLIKQGKTRLRIGIGIMLALLAVIACRLIVVQGFDPTGLANAANDLRTQSSVLGASRGTIVDASGVVLAESIIRYDIVGSPHENNAADTFPRLGPDGTVSVVAREKGLSELAQALNRSVEDIRTALSGDGQFVYLARSVSPAVESTIAELRIPGITSRPVEQRTYPLGSVAGSVVGYVNEDGGAAGIEQTLNDKLKGADGQRTFQIGADGIIIPTATNQVTPATNGETVKLTIDSDLQFYAQNAIEKQVKTQSAEYGNVIVVEVSTGKIRAMAETGTVDPNNPGATKAQDRGARSVTAAIEPGSTEKAITAAAAIQEGKIQPLSHILVPPTYSVNGQTFQDSFVHGEQQRTFAGIIGDSMNTGTVMVGEKLSREQRYEYLRKFGIGEKTGIPLPGESSGLLAQPDKWDSRQEFSVLFGQGVAQTALQTAMAFQTIANDGVRLKPQLIESITDQAGVEHAEQPAPGTEVIDKETAHQVRDILESVVTAGGAKDVKVPGYRVGGKTGTAEAVADNGAGFDGFTASFVGMAPMDNPQYVVMVNVQRPKGNIYGISEAGVFNDVMARVLMKYQVPPSTTPAVSLAQQY
ncbi:peptidoglycan glycosyltransferase [Arthrobacter sp. MWB30]|nr:peptidoglycan glycosyltransferase [Arthrobacter sp. MWB30]